MIAPLQKDSALLADIHFATEPALWWLGQSGFLFRNDSHFALIDPYLSDSLTEKYAGTKRPHVRLTERCVDPARLGFVTVVLSTHGHTDHFDRTTLRAIAGAENRTERLHLIPPAANLDRARAMLSDLDVTFTGVDSGQWSCAAGFSIMALPAAHPELARDGEGHELFLGYIIEVAGRKIYHSGDTLWHDTVVRQATAAGPDIALLPINGNDPSRGVAGNLDGDEAARLAATIGARVAIPQHFDMFAFNTATPESFEKRCTELGVVSRTLRCGERWDIAKAPAARS